MREIKSRTKRNKNTKSVDKLQMTAREIQRTAGEIEKNNTRNRKQQHEQSKKQYETFLQKYEQSQTTTRQVQVRQEPEKTEAGTRNFCTTTEDTQKNTATRNNKRRNRL